MTTVESHSTFQLYGRIERQVYETAELAESVDNWDALTDRQKLLVIHDPADAEARADTDFERELARIRVAPEDSETVYNVTVERLHEYFVDNLDRNQTGPEDNLTIEWLGLGNDATSGTSVSDTDLNNRTLDEQVTDVTDQGTEIVASTLIASDVGNGQTFDELGLFTGDPANLSNADVFLLNHATFGSITKDSSSTITFDVTLKFIDA